jgi:serine/threonine protein kinase
MGILGVRLLQLVGLFFELSPEDRQTLSHVYAKVQGQSKLQAFVVLRRETERNEVFRQLFNQIDKIKQMVGGGSIVTVYEVATKDGRRWAVGVKNPNAEFWARELLEFIQSIIQNMIEEDPANPQLQLLNRLLTDAFHWIGDEINDPDYLHKNERFFIHNDYRSQDENRFQASEGISWQIFVPQIQDTQTDWVRWEEFVEGVELVEFMNTEPAEDTDFQKKVLSREDARQVVSLIVQNYAHQLFVTGLVHSDVHPGNFLLTADRKVAILDRKNLLDFASQEEKGLLEELINLIAEADKDKLIDFIARRFIPERGYDPDLLARIKSQMANKFNPEAPEEYIGSLLMASKKEGIEIPLKYLLVLKNILALNRLSQWAGYKNVVDALVSTEVEKGLPGDVSVKLEEGVLEAFTVKIQKDILKKICVFGKAFQQLLAQFTPQLERHVSLDSLKQGIEQITQLGENGIEALGDVDIQIKLDNPQEQKMYARIRDVLQELQLPQGRVTSVAILAKLPNIIRQFRFLEDNPEQQRIFFSLIEKLTKEISEILRNDTTDLTVSKDLASRVAEKTIAASVEGLGAANTATGTASGQTALLITDDAGNAARREIKDILLSATDFGIKDVICLEVSPKGSISDIEAVLNAMGQVTRVFTYFTSAQARDSILSFLSGKALDLSGTSSEDLELKIKEHLASAASAGTSL